MIIFKYTPIIAVAALLATVTVEAQPPFKQDSPINYHAKGNYRNIKIGEMVPDFDIPKIINTQKKSAKISDFKDQLLIVDFWSINCSGCIAGLPKMDSLQKQFGDKIKVLPVTWEDESTVSAFWKSNKLTKTLKNLNSVVEDKNFSSHFQHESVPHEVWIYKGKLIGITEAEYVDANNIQKILNGKEVDWPVKDDYFVFDYNKPLFNLRASQKRDSLLKYSGILGYQKGAYTKKGVSVDTLNNSKRYYFINYSILAAYKALWQNVKKVSLIHSAIRRGESFTPTQLKLEVKDPSKYVYRFSKDYFETWKHNNTISYEFVSPGITLRTKNDSQKIISDLDRLLKLHGRWEKRATKCLVLIRTSNKDKIKSSGGQTQIHYDTTIKKLRNSPVKNIVYLMNSFFNNPPVFDGTNYSENVDLDLNISSWTDIPALRSALHHYDLDLKEEQRDIDIFVFTEEN